MASFSNDASGNTRILFTGRDGKRYTIRPGKFNKKNASELTLKVERLNSLLVAQLPLDVDTARWVADIGGELAAKLAAVGLIPERPKAIDIAGLIEQYRQSIAIRQKPSTQTVLRTITNDILGYFKPTLNPNSVTEAAAENFKQHLVERCLAPATVSRRLRSVRTTFAFGLKKKLITANPFAAVSAMSTLTKERRVYVPVSDIEIIMGHANPTWRTILALTRYAGLRCPTEVLTLRCEHIDFANNRMTALSPKTEHIPGKESRTMPIFGNLKPHLEEAFKLAEAGEVYVVGGPQGQRYREKSYGPNGWVGTNLRSTFGKLIRRSGLKQWPKLFQTLRASCETDLWEERFPINAVTEWMGHSAAVALRHYSRVPEHLYTQAAEFGKRRTESGTLGAQKAAQSEAYLNDQETTIATKTLEFRGFRRILTDPVLSCSNEEMGGEGLEPPTSSL